MLIAIGSDHAGFDMKQDVMKVLQEHGHECVDFGTDTPQSVDYPDYGEKVSSAVSCGKVERGVLICGTGIGMSIVANKFPGVRAALCNELFSARMCRMHNDANILVIGGRIIGRDLAKAIVHTWLTTPFESGRHLSRLRKICLIEQKVMKNKSEKTCI